MPREDNVTRTAGYQAFDHILWYVGNAKQAASYYVTRMGFKHVAYVVLSHVRANLFRKALRPVIVCLPRTSSKMALFVSSSDRLFAVPTL